MLPNQNLISNNYTGIVIITDLSGKFLNGYRIENSVLKTQISINKETSNKYLARKSSSEGCLEHSEYNGDCYWCTQYLDEVEIIGKLEGSSYISITALYNPETFNQGGGANTGMGWDPGPGEGTSYDDNTGDCTGGKVKNAATGKCECPEGMVEDSNGNCVTPCEELNNQIIDTDYRALIDALKKKTGEKQETGYVQNKDGTYTQLPVINGGHSLDLNGFSTRNTIGFVHTHLNNFPTGKYDSITGAPEINQIYRMFSPADVIKFLTMAKYTEFSGIALSDIYVTMVSSEGSYTLKFTGNTADIKGLKSKDDYEDIYIATMNKFRTNKELGFLLFLKNEIGIKGIELYKLHKPLFSSTIEVQSKTLDINGKKVETADCN